MQEVRDEKLDTARPFNRNAARAALRRIRERAEHSRLGRFEWPEWKAYRDEGRPQA